MVRRFTRPHAFSERLALVFQGKTAGYIGGDGKFIIQPSDAGGGDFSEGLAAIRSEFSASLPKDCAEAPRPEVSPGSKHTCEAAGSQTTSARSICRVQCDFRPDCNSS